MAQYTLEIRLVTENVPEAGSVFSKVVDSIYSKVFFWLPMEKREENTLFTIRFQIL